MKGSCNSLSKRKVRLVYEWLCNEGTDPSLTPTDKTPQKEEQRRVVWGGISCQREKAEAVCEVFRVSASFGGSLPLRPLTLHQDTTKKPPSKEHLSSQGFRELTIPSPKVRVSEGVVTVMVDNHSKGDSRV